jgi:hypothetical protein
LLHLREPAGPPTIRTPELSERRADPGATEVEPRQPEPPPVEQARTCGSPVSGAAELVAGGCLAGNGVRISALTSSQFEWTSDRVLLRSGELAFDVDPRPDHPFAVIAGDASIEVVGTSFVVHQDAELGWISLLEGHVRVRVGTRAVEELREGEQLEWSAFKPTAPAPVSNRRDDEGLATLLEEVAGLRRRGEYQAAIEQLRAGDRSDWSVRSRQLVSFEIGTLLERQLGDLDAACKHWAVHRERYPNGRYESIILRSMTRMHCDG